MNKRLKPIPKFANETAERAFWVHIPVDRIHGFHGDVNADSSGT